MKIKAQLSMVMNLDKCIGCHTCSMTCKNTWTNRPGAEYIWFNNVETKPGIGYPKEWENQTKYKGGWEKKNNQLQLKVGHRLWIYANIFHNPDMPTMDEYYEPWTYDYDTLLHSPVKNGQPIAYPKSQITGKDMKIVWGPNWEDDLAGSNVTSQLDPNMIAIEEGIKHEFEQTFMFYLPRICEHCLNPACVAACPSAAIYKRDEDGIVLIDQNACRSWRFCVSSCPYKKIYFNWKTHKSEKCTFCYPRVEIGLPTICSETCVGRIRYIGVILYDADRVKEAASVSNEQELYQSQLSIFLNPWDDKVINQAQKDGIPDDWIQAAQRSPIYQLVVEMGVALPLHPEYRTLPMIWYIPPLSPILKVIEGDTELSSQGVVLPTIDQMRIPIQYLANLLTAGNQEVVRLALKKLLAMRGYMRSKSNGQVFDDGLLDGLGMDQHQVEKMYRLLAIAKYEDRFVIPNAHKELDQNLYLDQGMTGFMMDDDCQFCTPGE